MTTSDQSHSTFTTVFRTSPQEISLHLIDDVLEHDHYSMDYENNSGLELREGKPQKHTTNVSHRCYIEHQDGHMTQDYIPSISHSTHSSSKILQSLRKKSSRILTDKERRINHSKSEQRRRQQLKTALSVLEQLIPDDISIDMNLISEFSGENNNSAKNQIQLLYSSIPLPYTESTIINRAAIYIKRLTVEQVALNTRVNQLGQMMCQSYCSTSQYPYPHRTFLNHIQSTPLQSHQAPMHTSSGSLGRIAFVNSSFHNTGSYSTNTIIIPFNNPNQQQLYNDHHQIVPKNLRLNSSIDETIDPFFHNAKNWYHNQEIHQNE